MTPEELARLRPMSPSMGIMLESDLRAAVRKRHAPLRLTGQGAGGAAADAGGCRRDERMPFTTGILIGIGETRAERIESLLAIREIHVRYGHVQEIIVQNFRAKPETKMANAPEPDLNELLWTIAVARILFGPHMSIQAPPNLSPGVLPQIVAAGINDWGGVSPLTPDFVNPEAPWPHLDDLAAQTKSAGKFLHERLTIYPRLCPGSRYLGRTRSARADSRSDRCRRLSPYRRLEPGRAARAAGRRSGRDPPCTRERVSRYPADSRQGRRRRAARAMQKSSGCSRHAAMISAPWSRRLTGCARR